MKKTNRILLVCIAGFLVAGFIFFLGFGAGRISSLILPGRGSVSHGTPLDQKKVQNKLSKIDSIIRSSYLYNDEIDEDALTEGIYQGFVDALNEPYTVYYTEEETEEILNTTSGEFYGVGAVMTTEADSGQIVITSVYEDSPAEKAGMKAGDVITAVDGTDVQGMNLQSVVARIKGDDGTSVTITVLRAGESIDLHAVRAKIQAKTVFYEMLEGQVGYIQVTEFAEVTYGQFKEGMDQLESQGMKGLIIDLRNNPGGNLSTVTDMLRLLLPEGVIVSTKDRNGTTEEQECDGKTEFHKPLAILVNQYSASASEIFSGAVQDYKKGKIVGVKTYGKGVVQTILSLGDGTSLKLTTSEYFLPSGRSINGVGVTPDVEVEYKRDDADPKADNQLDKAVETIKSML